MTALLDAAHAWHNAGYAVVPVRPDGSKAPAVAWRGYQEQRPEHDQITTWFSSNNYDGLGVLTGSVSGELELLEFEGRAVAEGYIAKLRELLVDHNHAQLWPKLETGYTEATPSGGLHLLYRVAGPAMPNTKLARRPATPDELADNPRDRVKVLIETRGAGGFVVIAPSAGRTHPTGRAWVAMPSASVDGIPTLSIDERDALYAIARLLNSYVADEPQHDPQPRTAFEQPAALRPGDDYNQRGTWEELLEPHGWKKLKPIGSGWLWRRPGKSHGQSATTDTVPDLPGLYVFTSSTEFDPERRYSRFSAYALLNHGGDHRAAAAALRQAGYGEQHPTSIQPFTAYTTSGSNALATVHSLPAADTATDTDTEHTTWWPRDLIRALNGEITQPETTHLRRHDGHALFYPGRINGLIGESESGKTWIALLATLQTIQLHEPVLYLDFEDDEVGVGGRLRSMGATDDQLAHVIYMHPEESLGALQDADLRTTLATRSPILVIVDGFNAAMSLLGMELESNTDATRFAQVLLRPLADTGACVVYVDHVPKNKDQRGKGGIGAQAKRAMTTGSAFIVEVTQPFGRGMRGELTLTIDKDRPGRVRDRNVSGNGKSGGKAILVSDADTGNVTVHIEGPDLRSREERGPWRPTFLMEKVSQFLASVPEGVSKNEVRKNVDGKNEHLDIALDRLVEEGFVVRKAGPRNAVLHVHYLPYVTPSEGAFEVSDTTSPHLAPPRPDLAPEGANGVAGDLAPPHHPLRGGAKSRPVSNDLDLAPDVAPQEHINFQTGEVTTNAPEEQP